MIFNWIYDGVVGRANYFINQNIHMQGIPQGQSSQNSQGGSQPRREPVGVPTGASGKPSLSWQSPSVANKAPGQDAQDKMKAPDKVKKERSTTTTYAGIFLAGLVVGILLGWGIVAGRGGISSSQTATSTNTQSGSATNSIDLTGSAMGGLQGLSIASGQEAGTTVAVSHVSVEEPTWVIIYDDEGGFPGKALGAQLFFPPSDGGETSGTVSLIRNTLPGHRYLAGERVDDGDHTFSSQNDTLVTTANGNALTIQFTIK
ncbi:MAG: hypothetical protein Q7R71_00945 [bacterium]|nr:hypothetical protein [bacterium]